jgi:quercetin dioxygenase-like cupin family protein
MRRFALLLSLVAVFVLGSTAWQAPLSAVAQDATPAAAPDEMEEEGVTFAPIGFAEGVSLPSAADLIAMQVTIEPGAVSTFLEDDPSTALLVVESGTFTIHAAVPLSISRAALVQQAFASTGGDELDVFEAVAADQDATLDAGDAVYIPGNIAGEIRNDGQEPAVGTVFLVLPGGSLSGEGAPEATPAA